MPDTLRLSNMYEGCGDAELTVHVLQYKGTNSIIDQYISFCKIANEQRKKYGYTVKAVEETIRICIEQNILASFLRSHHKEVQDIMTTLFDQETIMRIHDYRIGQEKLEEGIEKGIHALITSLRNLAIDKKTALQQVITQFDLSEELAPNFLHKKIYLSAKNWKRAHLLECSCLT